MSRSIPPEKLKRIIDLLSDLATVGDAQDFYKDLIRAANLPKEWVKYILEQPVLNSSKIINWALDQGKNTQDESYYTLGSILNVFKEKTGHREEIAIFMVQYELCDVKSLPQDLQSNINVTAIINENLEYPIISKNAQKELALILELIDFSIVKQACIRSLPRRAHHDALSIERVDQVFKLLELKQRKDGKYRILEFGWRLCEDDEIHGGEIYWKLEKWSKQYECKFESPLVEHTNDKNTPQPRLFIKVKDSGIKANQFSVEACLIPDRPWLISDSDAKLFNKKSTQNEYFYLKSFPYLFSDSDYSQNIPRKLSTKIEQDTCIKDLSFSKDELKELWGLFVTESTLFLYREEEQERKENDFDLVEELTIEVFLPLELLCDLDFEGWSFYNIFEEKFEDVGSSYRILIRSLERSEWLLSNKESTRNKKKALKKKWNSVRNYQKKEIPPTNQEFPLLDTNSFDKAILDEKIGVKLMQKSRRDEILEVIIIDKNIPIALWRTQSDSEVDFESELQELVHRKPLLALPESVRKLRKAAQESGCQNHLGSNLVLLWDDPNSLFPSIGNPRDPLK